MTRRLSSCLSALVIGALIAGCGSSSTSTHTASPTTGLYGVSPAASAQQALALCRGMVRLASYLSASDKAKFDGVCTKGASGTTEQARNTFREVCIQVTERSGLPRVEKEQVLAGCKARAGH